MTATEIEALAATLDYFRYHPWLWSNPDHLTLDVELETEEEVRRALDSLGLVWPGHWDGEPHSYDIDRDCTCDVGRCYLRLSITNQTLDSGLERVHLDTARRIETSLESAGLLSRTPRRPTLALAHRDPTEYIRRFQEISSPERVAHVARLSDDERIAHIDTFYRVTIRARPMRFHLRVRPKSERLSWVGYSVAFPGETFDRKLGDLDATPEQLAQLRAWMLGKHLDPPWMAVKEAGSADRFDERFARGAALFQEPRVVGIELALGEPRSERGEAPLGAIALAVRLLDADSVNGLVVLAHDNGLPQADYEDQAPRIQAWADSAATRFGVPCALPTSISWQLMRY